MEKNIRNNVKYAGTASKIWSDLKERFGKESAPRAYELKQKIASTRQGGASVSKYFTQLRYIWDEAQSIYPFVLPLHLQTMSAEEEWKYVAEDTLKAETLATLIITSSRWHMKVITEYLGMNLENMGVEMLGTCKKVTVLKDDTDVLDVPGDKKAFGERCEQAILKWLSHSLHNRI
ncbi:LTR copia-type gag-polypeptide [Tanacetum coccineum]